MSLLCMYGFQIWSQVQNGLVCRTLCLLVRPLIWSCSQAVSCFTFLTVCIHDLCTLLFLLQFKGNLIMPFRKHEMAWEWGCLCHCRLHACWKKSSVIPHSQDVQERGYSLLYSECLNFNLYKYLCSLQLLLPNCVHVSPAPSSSLCRGLVTSRLFHGIRVSVAHDNSLLKDHTSSLLRHCFLSPA